MGDIKTTLGSVPLYNHHCKSYNSLCCRSTESSTLVLFQKIDPLSEYYLFHFKRMCSCGPPESCMCQRGPHAEVEGPFDFPKLHGCLPKYCMCAGHPEPVEAPPVDFYLRPLAQAVGAYAGEEVKLVRYLITDKQWTLDRT